MIIMGIYIIYSFFSIILQLINENKGDLEVIFNNDSIKTISNILSLYNDVFKKLINENNNNIIKLDSDITKNSFIELERYYGNGIVKINKNNVIEIINICLYCDEKDLLNKCINYISKHINMVIIINLLNNNRIFKSLSLLNIDNIIKDYLIYHCYELFIDGIILFI